uniref:Uncharacterized protein n=1 Tax=Ixodes ricinus TaxID=34613 RepID=A0A090XBL1_IXORI
MRRLSKENRDATEVPRTRDLRPGAAVETSTPCGRPQRMNWRQQLEGNDSSASKHVREELRRKLQELMGNLSPGTELPEITQGPKPPNPSVSISLDSFFEETLE